MPAIEVDVDHREEARILRLVDKHRELCSYADAWLDRDSLPALEVSDFSFFLLHSLTGCFQRFFMDEPPRSSDDPLGYTMLCSDVDTDHIPVSPFYVKDRQLCADLFQLASDIQPTPAFDLSQCDYSMYAAQVGPVLRSFRHPYVPLSDASLYLHYGPWIRRMITVEDDQKAAAARLEEGVQRRRATRNSQKSDHSSWLSLQDEERILLRSSGLCM